MINFVSYGFIIFAAAMILLYYVVPARFRWVALLCGSIFFYAFAGWAPALVMASVATVTYFAAVLIGREADRESEDAGKRKKRIGAIFYISAGLIVAALAVSRLTDFVKVPGMSFFALMAIGYITDVKRLKYPPEKNYFKVLLFVMFFPQIPQGPINRFDKMSKTLYSGASGRNTYRDITFGVFRCSWGFLKKLVIADRVAPLLAETLKIEGGAFFLLSALLYAVRLYCDFTGGIDIALGISESLGITQSENFDTPYFSTSVADYWRRWHITLGTWMKDYVFYPISVSKPMLKLSKWARKSLSKGISKRIVVYISTLVTWLLVGLWHGTGLNFILWGGLNCIIILISQELNPLYKRFSSKYPGFHESKIYLCFEMARTFVIMGMLRMLDCFSNVGEYFKAIGSIFTNFIPQSGKTVAAAAELAGWDISDVIIVASGCVLILFVSILQTQLKKKNISRETLDGGRASGYVLDIVIPLITALFVILVVLFGAYGKGYVQDNFIYTRF